MSEKRKVIKTKDYDITFTTSVKIGEGRFNVDKFLKAAEKVGYIIKRNEAENQCGITQE